ADRSGVFRSSGSAECMIRGTGPGEYRDPRKPGPESGDMTPRRVMACGRTGRLKSERPVTPLPGIGRNGGRAGRGTDNRRYNPPYFRWTDSRKGPTLRSQSLISPGPSPQPPTVTRVLPVGEKATHSTQVLCPFRSAINFPVAMSQSLTSPGMPRGKPESN